MRWPCSSAAGPRRLGAHLEGPFLSPAWPGAHPPEHLLEPDLALVDELRGIGPITTMTVAPELPGGLDLVAALVARGIVVHIGHTDADAATAHAAFDRGARALTHIHNAHRRFGRATPGRRASRSCARTSLVTAIVDGVHLARETAGSAWLAARERLCLITDAIAAAGMGDGTFRLGEREVVVADGASRLADGTLAGSTVTMDRAVRELVALGASTSEAVYAATAAPARLLGRDDLGRLEPGRVRRPRGARRRAVRHAHARRRRRGVRSLGRLGTPRAVTCGDGRRATRARRGAIAPIGHIGQK